MAGQKPLSPPPPPPPPPRADSRRSLDSESTVSATSLLFERIGERAMATETAQTSGGRRSGRGAYDTHDTHDMGDMGDMSGDRLTEFDNEDPLKDEGSAECDLETGPFLGDASGGSNSGSGGGKGYKKMDKGLRRTLIVTSVVLVVAWVGGLFLYISHQSYKHASQYEHDPLATTSRGDLRKVTRAQLDSGFWTPKFASVSWIAGADGADGLVRETGMEGKGYLVVEDVRSMAGGEGEQGLAARRTLVQDSAFQYGGMRYAIGAAVPSPNLAKVLLAVNRQSNWRHSETAAYFVLDVATQQVQPLVTEEALARVQLAQWSPTSEAIAFARDNNLYVRTVTDSGNDSTTQVTTDGGAELFYGVPDWVYEEEVLGGASATWWSPDGRYLAFLRTNETGVPSYPVQYFLHRPSGTTPAEGEENYPEVRQIKYPKAGAANPVVDLQFYAVGDGQTGRKGEVFTVPVSGDFGDADRLITTVVWAGAQKVVIKETNRVSSVMRVVVVDVAARTGQAVRTVDVGQLDGGWYEISQRTRYVPADTARQRPADGYIDTIIHNGGDQLAYFSPPENPEPILLTTGSDWEVVDAPSAVDLQRNLVYFLGTREGSTQRHLYSVQLLDGQGLAAVTNTSTEGFYSASFSTGAGYVLLGYRGPGVPWQKVISTPAAAGADGAYEHTLEDNRELAERARQHALPLLRYGTLDVGGGVSVNYVERRPRQFDPSKRYPVLFQQYSGPGSQEVKKTFQVDFQSYVAASLGYVVVTVDPRGTGFRGRAFRVPVRGHLGVLEAQDQIAAARHWAGLPYVDGARLAIWGWSYGGFMALKTLEQDAGQTFGYGVAVAPVTDWRFYDSIYTERYMDTPQANAAGYDASAVQNATALAQNKRFLIMHGVADDNVHLQNSLALLDRLDLEGASNYDVHVFPDSDHGIYFHNGHQIVYDKLENWLINAFNGEWLKVAQAKPQGR